MKDFIRGQNVILPELCRKMTALDQNLFSSLAALKEKSTALMSKILSIIDEQQFQKEPKEQKVKKIFTHVTKQSDLTFMLQNVFQVRKLPPRFWQIQVWL